MTSGDTGAGSQITDEFRQIWKEKINEEFFAQTVLGP
jgi:hypothetical protein